MEIPNKGDSEDIQKKLNEYIISVASSDHPNAAMMAQILINGIEDLDGKVIKGANPNAKDKDDRTPLHLTDNPELARILIDSGADLNAKDKDGRTSIDLAIERGNTKLLETLCRDMSLEDKNKHLVSVIKSSNPSLSIVKTLVEMGADINAKDKDLSLLVRFL